jgi:hypothetical protein
MPCPAWQGTLAGYSRLRAVTLRLFELWRVGVPVMAGFQDHAAAGGDRLRVGHADREQVVEALKGAFVQGQLTRDELDMRVGQALAARTGAELAALTADVPVGPAVAGPVLPRASTRRRPLTRAAAISSPCLAIASAALWVVGHLDNPLGPSPYRSWIPLCLGVAIAALVAALFIVGYGVGASIEQRRSRGPHPALPGDPGLGFMS